MTELGRTTSPAPVLPHDSEPTDRPPALRLSGLGKRFGEKLAVDGLDLEVPRGSFYGFVGPNGAGKTTTLSMATGLLRPDHGRAEVGGVDVWARPLQAKRSMGVLADGVMLFNRLSGEQLVTYAGLLRGMDRETVAERTADLLRVLGLIEAAGQLVADYSAGMTKKIALASAMIHAPELLVLDEPFEAVDPVSARTIRGLLDSYVASGGTVILSSHVMDLVQRMCSHVGIIAEGRLLVSGTVEEVRDGGDLESRFVELIGLEGGHEELSWLRL
ncbi:ABC transporter ATP-binding protein [Nesterenkonia xinjiangensis]|uniref:ABC-2 type transport system ATP-binding protein n=1 Tax=Nesterenkonia xinjiangensis TaxID=225327 RepID=A0A7Z0GK85_9MICC|nr:ABC transporter ATP-binding protein [Nesterenkonia xinjiangensis]NYJ76651.1 ABC-2 type transport system ATP-binding protein [Nesterenkonia xinjiangensis]